MANVLIKPQSERDGNLVVLADNTSKVYLVDVTTGEILEEGIPSGPSNGRESTTRFSRPGSDYKNVGIMDDKGNVLLTMPDAGDRVQFNYQDYNALTKTPVSTIEGYRWSNQQNLEAQAQGAPSNAEIGQMSSEEYSQWLESQQTDPSTIKTPVTDATNDIAKFAPIFGPAAANVPLVKQGLNAVGGVTNDIAMFAPILGPAAANVPLVSQGLGALGGAFGLDRKTTDQFKAERTQDLMSQSDNPVWQERVAHFRNVEHGPNANDGAFNADEALEAAKQDGRVLWGSSPVLQTFGNEWFEGLDDAEREGITRGLAQNGFFTNEKGDWQIRDVEGARSFAEGWLQNQSQASEMPPEAFITNPQPDLTPPPTTRSLVPSEASVEPPVESFEQVPGEALMEQSAAAEEAAELQRRMAAMSFLQSAQSDPVSSQIMAQAFQPVQSEPVVARFANIQDAF